MPTQSSQLAQPTAIICTEKARLEQSAGRGCQMEVAAKLDLQKSRFQVRAQLGLWSSQHAAHSSLNTRSSASSENSEWPE